MGSEAVKGSTSRSAVRSEMNGTGALRASGGIPPQDRREDDDETGSSRGRPGAEACRGRVLLVEDNPINQEVAETMLELLGCRVVVAENGLEALERLEQEQFDLIFMDCQMPEMDGYEATKAIRENEELRARDASSSGAPPHIAIIALTGYGMIYDRDRCLGIGMDDYLSKPYRFEQLEDMLNRWLPKR